MRFKKALGVAAVLALSATGLAACGGGAGGSDNKTIAVVAKGYASPFWAAVRSGVEQAGKDLGYTVTFNGPDTETDVPRQNDQLNQALVKRPAALVFAALDSDAQGTVLQQFQDASIPVVAFDSGVPGSEIPKTTVATDNKAAAAEGAQHMAELIGKKGKVAIICHSQTSLTGQDREKGFKEWVEKNAPEIQIVDTQYNNSDQAVAQQQAAAILQANPDVVGIFATDDDGAVAAAQATDTAGMTSTVKIVGFDSGKPQMDLITKGTISGSVTQNPFQMGYEAVKAADKVIKGETLDKFIDSGYYWYDKNNMSDENIKKAVYE
ncbi:ABC transporter substrate-binding protein [Actinomyces trachealis]|uniref:ABC transporter substrate-binding protein n=1 Tax=Actinomyces trachealis TaxID=2763540 RepID=UPI0018C64664|nr:ABC transporter substrate-binding protein [Actinomyces trachealis]